MIKKMLLFFLCFTLFLSMPGCKKKLPTTPDIPTKILPTIEYFTATPESISPGESSILSWSVTNATNVTIDQGVGTVSAKATTEVSPEETTTYTLTATNSDGRKTQACTIEVIITVQSIAVISSSDLLYIGISETFTATATMSDGSTKAVIGGVWGGDNPSVATVEVTTGQVTIVGSGVVNIFVDYQGQRGTKAIRGLPNYQGTWSGSYIINSCNATGDFLLAGFCDIFAVGTVAPIDLVLMQDQDRVTGRFYLGDLSAATTGPVATNGQLPLTGLVPSDPFTIDVLLQLQSTMPDQITGTLDMLWLATGFSGSAQLSCNILDLNRTSTMTMAPIPPRKLTPTLQDVLRALLKR
jgi:hypothetical protein